MADIEFNAKVFTDDGAYYEIGPDRDGLGIMEFVFRDPGSPGCEIYMTIMPEHINPIAEAMLAMAKANNMIAEE